MSIILQAFYILLIAVFVSSCSTANRHNSQRLLNNSKEENIADAVSAMKSVAEAVAQKELTEEELKNLAHDLQSNKDSQSAVEAITNSLSREKPKIKYSPSTGKRYSAELEFDPETGERLLDLE